MIKLIVILFMLTCLNFFNQEIYAFENIIRPSNQTGEAVKVNDLDAKEKELLVIAKDKVRQVNMNPDEADISVTKSDKYVTFDFLPKQDVNLSVGGQVRVRFKKLDSGYSFEKIELGE